MKFFRKTEVLGTENSYPPYWSEYELGLLAKELTGESPNIGFEITRAHYRIDLGDRARRAGSREFSSRLELSGRRTRSPVAAFNCEFCILPDEINEAEYHGYLILESHSPPGGALYPVFSARFNVPSQEYIEKLRLTIQPALNQCGNAYISFSIERIKEFSEWVGEFSANNFSPSLAISGLTISTSLYDRPL